MNTRQKKGCLRLSALSSLRGFSWRWLLHVIEEPSFEDVGHLIDGPVSQQILKGTYKYPQDLDPATRLMFEEAAHTYAALSPMEIATYVTPEDFQHFWHTD